MFDFQVRHKDRLSKFHLVFPLEAQRPGRERVENGSGSVRTSLLFYLTQERAIPCFGVFPFNNSDRKVPGVPYLSDFSCDKGILGTLVVWST